MYDDDIYNNTHTHTHSSQVTANKYLYYCSCIYTIIDSWKFNIILRSTVVSPEQLRRTTICNSKLHAIRAENPMINSFNYSGNKVSYYLAICKYRSYISFGKYIY